MNEPKRQGEALYEIAVAVGWRGPKWVFLVAGLLALLRLDWLSQRLISLFVYVERA